MSDLNDSALFIEALKMSLSEANEKYGSYIIVATDIASGRTIPNENYLRVLVQEKVLLERSLKGLDAIIELVEKNVK